MIIEKIEGIKTDVNIILTSGLVVKHQIVVSRILGPATIENQKKLSEKGFKSMSYNKLTDGIYNIYPEPTEFFNLKLFPQA